LFDRERDVEHNVNAVAAGRVAGVDPIKQITNRCIRIVTTFDEKFGGCALCRLHLDLVLYRPLKYLLLSFNSNFGASAFNHLTLCLSSSILIFSIEQSQPSICFGCIYIIFYFFIMICLVFFYLLVYKIDFDVCSGHEFKNEGFGPGTVILCDQVLCLPSDF
jgi:hypothetical protein